MSEHTALSANETTTPENVPAAGSKEHINLPAKRFEMELEFVQALASPAYLHFLATSRSETGECPILQDPAFIGFLKYLRNTWTQPEYSRFLVYPHCLYFLNMLIETPASLKEWTLPAYRNFCHQQQFLTWQHRHRVCYGRGAMPVTPSSDNTVVEDSPSTPIKPSDSPLASNKK